MHAHQAHKNGSCAKDDGNADTQAGPVGMSVLGRSTVWRLKEEKVMWPPQMPTMNIMRASVETN
ncbi:hypothetical protein BAR24_00425 [Gluconobacter oxydans]|uniref:hypothetical protein n=1 Tax=Gluconobacter thailandicus TaxID=257438 RepID=UPI0003773D3B|nr:hypothetical protein [Gluconobacter thailandicus]ANQ40063.1 hypothetical protein BAR24_00425 [Gluconobacter oxydans]